MASVAKTSAKFLSPCPKLCSNLYASRAFSVWNVSFSMAHRRLGGSHDGHHRLPVEREGR